MDIIECVNFWADRYEYESLQSEVTEDSLRDLAFDDLMDGLDPLPR